MKTYLNDYEVMTLNEAYNRIKAGREDRISLPCPYKTAKKHLPSLIARGLIHADTLKHAGMVVLTKKGIDAGKKLDEAISG